MLSLPAPCWGDNCPLASLPLLLPSEGRAQSGFQCSEVCGTWEGHHLQAGLDSFPPGLCSPGLGALEGDGGDAPPTSTALGVRLLQFQVYLISACPGNTACLTGSLMWMIFTQEVILYLISGRWRVEDGWGVQL